MSLHDKYQTLLRRGMPKHPELSYDAGSDGWWSLPCGDETFEVSAAIAEAILTMWALKWAQTAERKTLGRLGAGAVPDIEWALRATAHLEPR